VGLLDELVRCLFLFMFILLCGTWGTDYGHMAVAGGVSAVVMGDMGRIRVYKTSR